MKIKRKKSWKYINGKIYHVQAVFPIDFIHNSFFPCVYYKITESETDKNKVEVRRGLGDKPKSSIEAKTEIAIRTMLDKAILYPRNISAKVDDSLANDDTFGKILSVIYSLSFSWDKEDRKREGVFLLDKDGVLRMYYRSKQINAEPYSFIQDLSKERPIMLNPKRYTFNEIVLSTGIEHENREMEEQIRKSKYGVK